MSKVASSLANSKVVVEALDKEESHLSKVASETIRALSFRVAELEKIAKITEVITDLHNVGAIDESEIKSHVATLSEEPGTLGYATKIAQEVGSMFMSDSSASRAKRTMEDCINSKVRS